MTIKLDRNKPYGHVQDASGEYNPIKYEQDGHLFDINGKLVPKTEELPDDAITEIEDDWKKELLDKLDDYMDISDIRTALDRLGVDYSIFSTRKTLYEKLKNKLLEVYGAG